MGSGVTKIFNDKKKSMDKNLFVLVCNRIMDELFIHRKSYVHRDESEISKCYLGETFSDLNIHERDFMMVISYLEYRGFVSSGYLIEDDYSPIECLYAILTDYGITAHIMSLYNDLSIVDITEA